MSDFISHLFDRSFKSDDRPENVRPRLPSLFEKSSAGQTEFNTPFFNHVEQTNDETEFSPVGKSIDRHPMAPRERDTAAAGIQEIVNTSPTIAPVVSQFRKENGHSNTPFGTDQLSGSRKSTERMSSPNDALEQEFVFRSIPSLLQGSIENSSDTAQRLENKSGNTMMPNLPVSPPLGEKQDYKTARSETGFNNLPEKNEFQPLPGNQHDVTKLSSSFVADSALLERLVTEKIALQGNTARKPSYLLAPADTSNLNVPWPQAAANKQPLDNNNGMASNPPEPTIQVTIGRIEIRATQSTPGSVRRNQDKRPATMSLEEYLNKRNGGAG
ncbi:hypothetical protein [Methylosarcina fibrata]|uniref:hypothetical protein n=1 Tax=Methylosarcina fibrata TaxID=105972 RepID=UPI00037FD206|nr:hypothetical protein [Methylosarcina fibrata]